MHGSSKSLEETLYNAIQTGDLNGLVIEDFLKKHLAREWDYFDAIRCTMTYSEQCKMKNALYQIKMLLTFIRNCRRSGQSLH